MKNMDKSVKILIILLGIALILFVTNLVIDNNTSKDYSNAKYIEIKGEKIDSIYNVVGSKQITKVNEGIDTTGNYIEITYSDYKSKLDLNNSAYLTNSGKVEKQIGSCTN